MSRASLKNFLLKLDKELNRSSSVYRSVTANRRPHTFKFSSQDLAKQMKDQITKKGIPLNNKDRGFINSAAEKAKKSLETEIRALVAKNPGAKYKITKNTIRFLFTSSTIPLRVGQYTDPDSVFDRLKDTYRPTISNFFNEVQEYLKNEQFINEDTGRTKSKAIRTKSGKIAQASGRQLQAGHTEGESNIEAFIYDAFEAVLQSPVLSDSQDRLSEAELKKDLQKLGIDLTIVKNSKIDTHTISVESASTNIEGGQILKSQKALLQSQIKNALNNLESVADLKGSDSITTKYRKNAGNAVLANLAKSKYVKVVSKEDFKVKESSSVVSIKAGPKTLVKNSKNTKLLTRAVLPKKSAKNRARKGVSSSPLQLIGLLNRDLPRVVSKNMQAPGLENRTGRFASSVRVTDVIQTPQGFPSIGYTYMRNPYQTFEPGYKQGDSDRDPRKVIDQSIREIAAQYAVGRFYTRRV